MNQLARVWDIPLLLLLSLIWASAFSTIKVAVPVVGPLFLVTVRCGIGALLMFVVIAFMRKTTQHTMWPTDLRTWIFLILTGIISTALPFLFISYAEQEITSSLTGMLMTVGPLVAVLLAHFTTKDEKITPSKLLGVIIGFLGAVYLLRAGIRDMEGAGFIHPFAVIIAAAFYAVGGLMAKKMPQVSSEAIAAVVLLASALAVLPFLLLDGAIPNLEAVPIDVWGALLWLGVMPSGVAFYLRYFLIKRVGYAFVSYVGYLIPVFAIIIGFVWLSESVSFDTILAMGVIILGLFLSRGKTV